MVYCHPFIINDNQKIHVSRWAPKYFENLDWLVIVEMLEPDKEEEFHCRPRIEKLAWYDKRQPKHKTWKTKKYRKQWYHQKFSHTKFTSVVKYIKEFPA